MRLIDADAFKKYIEDGYTNTLPTLKTDKYRHLAEEMTKAFLKDIDEQPTVNQWIPITEKLPDLDKCVLATTSWGTITIAERWKDTKGEENWFVSEGECNAERDDIVAWKPLPEPYKGVKE